MFVPQAVNLGWEKRSTVIGANAPMKVGHLMRAQIPVFGRSTNLPTTFAVQNTESSDHAPKKPVLSKAKRFLRWLGHGMPLHPIDYETERKVLNPKQRLKREAVRRLPCLALIAAAVGIMPKIMVDRTLIPSLPMTPIARSAHPDPWPQNTKVYCAVADNSISYSYDTTHFGWAFKLIGYEESWFTHCLMNALKSESSLDNAYKTLKEGYGPSMLYASSNLRPVCSPEGPLGWNKEENKKRIAILVVGGREELEKTKDPSPPPSSPQNLMLTLNGKSRPDMRRAMGHYKDLSGQSIPGGIPTGFSASPFIQPPHVKTNLKPKGKKQPLHNTAHQPLSAKQLAARREARLRALQIATTQPIYTLPHESIDPTSRYRTNVSLTTMRANVRMVKETLKREFHLRGPEDVNNPKDTEIIMLDQPTWTQVQSAYQQAAQNGAQEVLVYFASEGFNQDNSKIPPQYADREGARDLGILLNQNDALMETDLKALSRETFKSKTKVSYIFELCNAGAGAE